MGVFDINVVIGGVGVFVQDPHPAGLCEIAVDGFDYVAFFHGFVGNKFHNACHRVTFLGEDDDFLTVAGVAQSGNAAAGNVGKSGAAKEHHEQGYKNNQTGFHNKEPPG